MTEKFLSNLKLWKAFMTSASHTLVFLCFMSFESKTIFMYICLGFSNIRSLGVSLLKRVLDSTICHPFKEHLLYYSGIGFACCFRSINNSRSNI